VILGPGLEGTLQAACLDASDILLNCSCSIAQRLYPANAQTILSGCWSHLAFGAAPPYCWMEGVNAQGTFAADFQVKATCVALP
jgi:hypothetical protein